MRLTAHITLLLAMLVTAASAGAATLTAASCSQAAVQASINAAAEGDAVVVPNGACTWTTPVTITGKGIRLTGATKGGVIITHGAGTSNLLSMDADTTHSVEISNLNFLPGSAANPAFYMYVSGWGKPVLIHDNYLRIEHFGVSCIHWGAHGGVIANNVFESLDANGAGSGCIPVKAESPPFDVSWTTASTFGAADVTGEENVYIEDNVFKKIVLQAIDPDGNARVVIRYNTFDNSALASHGADTGPDGMRHVELYNNTFIFTTSGTGYNYPLPLNYWMYIRGGSWVITDNVIPDISSQMWGDKGEIIVTVQNIRRAAGPYPCWPTYPAPRQFGQGHNGTSYVAEPAYIWNNIGLQAPGIADYNPDECGNNAQTTDFIQPNRDFYLGVAKPGYVKFSYPHPLRSAAATPTAPPAPTNLRVVQ